MSPHNFFLCQALANKLSATREFVSRILKKLENEGELQLDRGIILLNHSA